MEFKTTVIERASNRPPNYVGGSVVNRSRERDLVEQLNPRKRMNERRCAYVRMASIIACVMAVRSLWTFRRAIRLVLGWSTLVFLPVAFSLAPGLTALGAPGDLDKSFGASGLVLTSFGAPSQANAIVVQADGKIIVAGQASAQLAIARYNPDGTLDSTFGAGGKVMTSAGQSAAGDALAIQPDGRIIAAGTVHFNTSAYDDWLIVRYNQDGSLDNSFGSAGIVTTNFGTFDAAYSVQIQLDGKLVVGGEADSQYGVARYNPDGTLDQTFAVGGKTINTSFGSGQINALALLPNGRIVVAGGSDVLGLVSFGLGMYRANGSVYKKFGDHGSVITGFGICPNLVFSTDSAGSVAIQPDGRIVAAGQTFLNCGPDLSNFAIARYESNGALDPSFGSGGKLIMGFSPVAPGVATGRELLIQPDGRIVVGGYVREPGLGIGFGLVRFNLDGSFDTTFGSGGKVTTFFGDANYRDAAMALGRDGKIIGVGTAFGLFQLARYETGIPVPVITNAFVHGKTLNVIGMNFDQGAVILLNGVAQKTSNENSDPTITLISVGAGKVIRPGDTLRVQDPNGLLSANFVFTGTT